MSAFGWTSDGNGFVNEETGYRIDYEGGRYVIRRPDGSRLLTARRAIRRFTDLRRARAMAAVDAIQRADATKGSP